MQQQVQSILNDIDGAIRYVEEGANVHPNRIDIANGNAGPNPSANGPSTTSNPFSSTPANSTQPASNPFMKAPTATFGQSSAPGFGQPAFGQASAPAQPTPAFGQASNPGQAAPGFGSASNLGAKPSPFTSGPSAAVGTAFGKPAFGTSGFGQPSMPGVGSAFGQSNPLVQKSAFGQSSAPGTAAPFSQPSPMGQQGNAFGKPAFGQTGFGQASQVGTGAAPFGQAAQTNASPFAQQSPTQAAPPFGQPSQPTQQQPVFGTGQGQPAGGQSNPFATATSPSTNVFGQPNRPTTSGSPFGGQQNQPASPPAQNPFTQKPPVSMASPSAAPSPFGTQMTQPASTFAQASTQPTASMVAPGAGKEIDPKDRFKEGRPEEYEGEQGKMLEEIYGRVGQMGRFDDNEDIPLVPPKCEWIVQIPL
jgi:nucleoporin NUP42